MDATHLHCAQSAAVRPIRFEPLLAGEPALGTNIHCAACGGLAFTLIKPARFYCEICDDLRPCLLERIELVRPAGLGVLLVCGGCFDAKTVLYAAATASG